MVEKDVAELRQENAKQNGLLDVTEKKLTHMENSIEAIRDKMKLGFDEIKMLIFGLEKANEEQKMRFEEKKNIAINDVRKRAEESFASKLVEKIVYGMIATIMLAVIGALIGLVLVK